MQECALGRVGWGLTMRGLTGLAGLADAEYRIGAWDDSVSHAQQAISLATDTGQAWLLAFVHANAVLVLARRGVWDEAEAHVRAASAAATALGDRAGIAYAANAAVHLASCRGDPAGVVATAVSVVLILGLLGSVGLAPTAQAGDSGPNILSPSDKAYGMTYGGWSAAWWRWAVIGTADNPVADTTGASCGVRQTGKVWFLAGTFGGTVTRSCAIPAGKALFFPLVNIVDANSPGGTETAEQIRAQAKADIAGATASAEIDGVAVAKIQRYLTISPSFSLSVPDPNVLGAPGGNYNPAVAAGIHLVLEPLSPGNHVVHFQGCLPSGFCTGVTYNLKIAKGDGRDDR